MSNIYIVNSPQTHVLISDCKGFNVDNVMIQAPQNSPNTDGIHIHSSHYVKITNSIIGTGSHQNKFDFIYKTLNKYNKTSLTSFLVLTYIGDDCISIGDYTSHIDIANIECGPGHGIR